MSSLTFKGNRDKSNPSNNSLKKRERAVKSRQDSVHSFINSNDAQKEVLEVEKEEKSRQKQFIVQFINKRQSKYEKKKKHMRKVKMHRIKHSTQKRKVAVYTDRYLGKHINRMFLKNSPMTLDIEKLQREAVNKQNQRSSQIQISSVPSSVPFKAPKSQTKSQDNGDSSQE